MIDFNIVVVGAIGAGSLAFSFVEYALERKHKQQEPWTAKKHPETCRAK